MPPEQKKKILYHSSANISDDAEFLKPSWQKTAVHDEYDGLSEQVQHEGEFIFAGENKVTAYAYSIFLHHPTEIEGKGERAHLYWFITNVATFTAVDNRDGTTPRTIVAIVITRPLEFLKILQSVKPKIFAIPSEGKDGSYKFEQVYRKNGSPTGEFLCRTSIPIKESQITLIDGIDQVMREGVQILFLNESVSKKQWFDRDSEVGKSSKNNRERMAFLDNMIEQGILIHANRECRTNPIDFKEGKMMTPEQITALPPPSSWQHKAIKETIERIQKKPEID